MPFRPSGSSWQHIFRTRPTGTIFDGATGVSPVPLLPKTRAGTLVLDRNLHNNTPIQWSKTANFAAFVDGNSYRGRENPDTSWGVLTIHGFGVRVRMQSGHLEIEDGVGNERRTIRLARVNHNLRRLVCISDDGFVTLSALKWLSDIGASPVMLDRIRKVVFVTGPTAPSDVRLRLAQARALRNGTALAISKE
jgi:hypothetical protein